MKENNLRALVDQEVLDAVEESDSEVKIAYSITYGHPTCMLVCGSSTISSTNVLLQECD